jgi:site-specific DNA-methyltransferase (adenine-specific)
MIQREAPELIQRIAAGEMTIPEAKKEIRREQIQQERSIIANAAKAVPVDSRWNVYHADIAEWTAPRRYDFIITDPPYPREYLPLYETLAVRSAEWLKPDGLLVVMCGQSYLNKIYEMMTKHLQYYWTACYLLPGQPTPLRTRQVNTSWKPILIFSLGTYSGKIFGDVYRSDANDKDFHKWGQSVSGMYSVISQLCLPGQYILDPFCGAGTTGIAALKHCCLFDGVDIDAESVNISQGRLYDSTTT